MFYLLAVFERRGFPENHPAGNSSSSRVRFRHLRLDLFFFLGLLAGRKPLTGRLDLAVRRTVGSLVAIDEDARMAHRLVALV